MIAGVRRPEERSDRSFCRHSPNSATRSRRRASRRRFRLCSRDAICSESRVAGRDIGAIEIADRFSLVEVPEAAADEVVTALRGSTVKGRKPTVRRERYEAR